MGKVVLLVMDEVLVWVVEVKVVLVCLLKWRRS